MLVVDVFECNPFIFNPTANTPFLLQHISCSTDRESVLFHQQNSSLVIVSFVLTTSVPEELTLPRET